MRIKALLLGLLLLGGCASAPQEPRVEVSNDVVLFHPVIPDNPSNPGLKIKAITSERIASGELPDKAYIGFLYDDWLEFAKWMHKYKSVNEELRKAIQQYREQDTRYDQDSN
ncbi:hypothetical protein VspSw1_111 [Vibrio phage VspSw_1]|uniref:Uncharacterized protein n=2 Tax=Pogseptimavirus VspSw1 TaxID=2733997 RepID=A0A411BKU2_9CAUD|nr:Rz-like spanin [Vibrio phage VspSw_1]QAY02179.1 hypothetical protein VspSw1_111 [Vibrio phage VspSw_1]QKN88509.1 hypothetical protein vBValSX1_116 [Vibrio phage vB_ValS_X1]